MADLLTAQRRHTRLENASFNVILVSREKTRDIALTLDVTRWNGRTKIKDQGDLNMKTRVLAALALCAAAAPFVLSAQAIGTVEHDLNYGREYLAAGNPSSAATYFRQAATLHPDHAEANLLLAVALQRSGKASEARPYFQKALTLDPSLAARPEVQALSGALSEAARASPALFPADNAAKAVPASDADAPIGSAAYLLKYARDHLREGNFKAAEDYARQALAIDPPNALARTLLSDAQARRAPADASAATRAEGGDPNKIGTPAYFLRYAKHHMTNQDYSSAVHYAKQALEVDPNYGEARQMLAQAAGKAASQPKTKNSCEAQFSSCWSGAMTYTPGSGYSADNMRRQQCMVQRNICTGRK